MHVHLKKQNNPNLMNLFGYCSTFFILLDFISLFTSTLDYTYISALIFSMALSAVTAEYTD